MLITKFNKMIRNRWLWGAFAVIVVIAFVGVFSPSAGGDDPDRRQGIARIYGEDIGARDFALARFFAMGMRDMSGMSPEVHERVSERSWQRLAALMTAERMGIRTTDAEVAQQLQRDPNFAVNGRFSSEKYRQIIRSQWRFKDSVEMFEEYLRQEMTLQKLMQLLESAVWVSPFELAERTQSLTDEYVVHCLVLPVDTNATVQLDTEDLAAFYEEHKELFREPERMRVRYVAFPISNYLASVEVREDDVLQYYTNRLDTYSFTNAEGLLTYQPLEEVREEIAGLLADREAAFEAKDDATRFVVALAPDRAGRAPSMDEAARSEGLEISTSGYFAAYEDVPGMDVGPDFNRAALRLDADDPEGYFSDAVTGQDAVYVLAALDSAESHVPAFSNVVDGVRALAEQDALGQARLDGAAAVRDGLAESVMQGKSFEKAVSEAGLNIVTSCTFSAHSATLEDVFHAELLLPELITLESGEFTPAIEIDEGLLMAYVAERRPAPLGSVGLTRAEVLAALNRYRAETLFGDWQETNLKEAGFEDLRPGPAEESGGEEP